MIFPEQAEYATFANEMLKNQARKPDNKVAEVILSRHGLRPYKLF